MISESFFETNVILNYIDYLIFIKITFLAPLNNLVPSFENNKCVKPPVWHGIKHTGSLVDSSNSATIFKIIIIICKKI